MRLQQVPKYNQVYYFYSNIIHVFYQVTVLLVQNPLIACLAFTRSPFTLNKLIFFH